MITIAYVLEEVLRLKHQPMPIITHFTLKMSRHEERSSFIIRPLYLAIGIILTLILYPSSIAYSSISIGAIGDPVAAIMGGKFGRRHIIGHKTMEGFAAGLTASFLLASVIVSPLIAAVGSVGAMIMELVDVPDDNLTMPIVAGALMTLATLALR
jgi:dolichol kinase